MVLDSRVCNSTNTLTVAQENFWDFVSSSDFDVVACELAPFTFPSLQLFFSSSRSVKLTCFILQSDNSWSPHKIGWTVSGACGVTVSFEFDSPTPKRSLPSSLPPPSKTADHPILIASPTDYHHHLHIPHTPRSQLSKYDLSFSLSSQGAKGRNRLCLSSTSPQPADLLFSLFTSPPCSPSSTASNRSRVADAVGLWSARLLLVSLFVESPLQLRSPSVPNTLPRASFPLALAGLFSTPALMTAQISATTSTLSWLVLFLSDDDFPPLVAHGCRLILSHLLQSLQIEVA